VALWLQGALSVIWLACARGFEDVSGWFVTTSWVFYGITIAALWVQRRREARGELAAPAYRSPLHPLPAILFILVTAALIASDLSASGWRAAAGLIVAALGFPVYSWMKGRRRAA
jgi:uncharacterized membrane protein (DUF4010 family)